MTESLITYALSVYLAFWLVNRSDLLRPAREWATRQLPGWLTYPSQCALCFSWWSGLLLTTATWIGTGTLILSAAILFAAPVLNMVLDLAVRALIKANEPPLFSITTSTGGVNRNDDIVSIPSIWVDNPSVASWTTQTHSFIPYPDPVPSHIGRRARVVRGHWSCKGKDGVITRHFVCNDDCAGTFRKTVYDIEGVSSKVIADDCDLLPGPPPVPPTPAA